MEIIERFVAGKAADPALCEDIVVVTDTRVAVIDGATDKSGRHYQWHGATVTGGRFAAEVIAERLGALPAATEPADAVAELSATLESAIRDQYGAVPAHLHEGHARKERGDDGLGGLVVLVAQHRERHLRGHERLEQRLDPRVGARVDHEGALVVAAKGGDHLVEAIGVQLVEAELDR